MNGVENIVLSTAAFCLWHVEPIEKLKICKQLQFNEIEVALSTERMTRDFLEFLDVSVDIHSFQRIAVHAPWRGIAYGENCKTKKILDCLYQISKKISVSQFTFHADRVDDIIPLIRSGLPVCLENSEWDGCWQKLRIIVEKHELPLALNINRATRRHDYLNEITSELSHRISKIQISGYDGQNGRMPIVSANQLQVLDRIIGINAPIVLEGLFPPGDIDMILQERLAVWKQINSTVNLESVISIQG